MSTRSRLLDQIDKAEQSLSRARSIVHQLKPGQLCTLNTPYLELFEAGSHVRSALDNINRLQLETDLEAMRTL